MIEQGGERFGTKADRTADTRWVEPAIGNQAAELANAKLQQLSRLGYCQQASRQPERERGSRFVLCFGPRGIRKR